MVGPFPSPMMQNGGSVVLNSPLDLFTGGVNGLWWDPSDLATQFTDTAGTTPVTADGQLVARCNDKSGNGNHMIRTASINRPRYKNVSGQKYWLMDDSTGDWMVPFVVFGAAFGTTWSRVGGFNIISTAGGGRIYSDTAGSTPNDIRLWDDSLGYAMHNGSSAGPRIGSVGTGTNYVFTELWANPAPCQLAKDNDAYVATPSIAGVGPSGVFIGMGAGGSNHATMKHHGLLMINRALTAAEVAFLRTYYGAKQGRVL